MKRFQWKVLTLMLLVSITPLIFSTIVVDQLLKETVALGLDESLQSSLGQAADTHRRYIQLRRRTLKLETVRLSHDPNLQRLLGKDQHQQAAEHLGRWIADTDDPDMAVAAVELRPAAKTTKPIAIDHRDKYPEPRWRAKTINAMLTDEAGHTHQLAVTYVVPWELFERFEELGQVSRTFSSMSKRKNALTNGYTRAFAVFAGAILCVTFIAGYLLARATTGRLGQLANATARVGRGDLMVQVPVQGRDEIAQLTGAFNTMVVELRQAHDRVSYLERVSTWQEIAQRLAHEIKNPLTPILLAVQQLDRKFDDYVERPRKYRRLVSDAMEIVSEEVDSLRTLVQEFRDFARLPRVSPKPTDVPEFVRDVLRTNPQFAPHISPDAEISSGAPLLIAGIDGTMMRRVLINLITNAQQAINAAGRAQEDSIRIFVDELPDDGGVKLVVEDDGPGVKPEHLARLFDPYFTTKSDGTGLGLAIVKKVVLDHGGDIRCESPIMDDGGARFVVELPPGESINTDETDAQDTT